ncbi:hypothetical protein [Pseudomonas chlororaphis]|uniref:hypothetical protein n=1 Tax=Pseudomonas chlororaphis TaxID=587753 RepID=UPI0013DE2886|nr:hypothetical protein [Pseudomonas chlororaphis]
MLAHQLAGVGKGDFAGGDSIHGLPTLFIERFLVLAVGMEGPSMDQPVEFLKIAPGYDIQWLFFRPFGDCLALF